MKESTVSVSQTWEAVFKRNSPTSRTLAAAFDLCEQISSILPAPWGAGFVAMRRSVLDALPKPFGQVTMALERRISRENMALATQIERLAAWLRSAIDALPPGSISIPDLNYFDDISTKLLARVTPFSSREWKLGVVGNIPAGKAKLFERFSQVTGLQLSVSHPGRPAPTNLELAPTVDLLQRELVLNNYGYCFHWGEAFLGAPDAGNVDQSEIMRILGLASLNRGLFEQASDYFHRAEDSASSIYRKAHLSCLQSLVAQKRMYNPAETRRHIERGLALLSGCESRARRSAEWKLERAWLLNSMALDAAIKFRKEGNRGSWNEALKLIQEAFRLAKGESAPAHQYLRFNLAANTVFLFEMRGDYTTALSILERSFAATFDSGMKGDEELPEGFEYRRAIIGAKAGAGAASLQRLEALLSRRRSEERWFLVERILRACTSIAAKLNQFDQAREYAFAGFEICERNHSRDGARHHATDIVRLHSLLGDSEAAEAMAIGHLGSASIDEITGSEFSTPAPKLPAYVPEIDLEEVPRIDLNRFLVEKSKTDNR